MNKKVIAFSIWGEKQIYNVGAVRNADLALEIYEGWECWFYVGQSTPQKTIDELSKRKNCKVVIQPEQGDWSGMFWRFYPASDPNVEVMISRDADSRLSTREFLAVKEWEQSNKSFHIMRDHPHHQTEILGGMWGCKFPILKNMKKLINEYAKGEFWQVDQNFLREKIYPLIKNDAIVHDDFFAKKPFPKRREPNRFVGQAFDEHDDLLNPEHANYI
jgi:protein O-GlcNAc transferase